jgi:uncharacterized MAPEG superfamily protein
MTIELHMLAYSVALLLLLVVVQAVAGVRALGLVPLANSRDGLPAPTGFHARMLRVVDNHREGLTMFAPLVLIASVAGVQTAMTALGAQLFFYSRVAHAAAYILGVPMIRPLIWSVGLVGLGIFLYAVVTTGYPQ